MFISEFKIDNFRSLKTIHLKHMQQVCIFYGENNSGKSSILAALEAVLKAKAAIEEAAAAGGEEETFYRQLPFYQGTLPDFKDNFRFGSKAPITFMVCVNFDNSELAAYRQVIEEIEHDPEAKPKTASGKAPQPQRLKLDDGRAKTIRIQGEFKYIDENTCEAVTNRIDINSDFVLFEIVKGESTFIPSLEGSKIELDERVDVVTGIANSLTNSFRLIGTNRSLCVEKLAIDKPPPDLLTPLNFKQSLFRLATDRDSYDVFKEIKNRFNGSPFSFGDISFAVDPKTEEVEIMIEKSSTRLPVSRMGSGLQQILFLIATIVYNSHKMIGVEEIELNLSPLGQKRIFETIKSLVYDAKLINQALVTSHSEYFQGRNDVGYFEVTYDPNAVITTVKPGTKESGEAFFAGGWERP
jgi:energy-coupling factor transporter ATP-binding protein EcfA2